MLVTTNRKQARVKKKSTRTGGGQKGKKKDAHDDDHKPHFSQKQFGLTKKNIQVLRESPSFD